MVTSKKKLPPNWNYFQERLEDVSLLDRAVTIECDGTAADLAVPVGGKRRGGWIALKSLRLCRDAIRQLRGREGFPNLRIQCTGAVPEYLVWWGDEMPDGVAERGRFFGYSEKAIQKYLKKRRAKDLRAGEGSGNS